MKKEIIIACICAGLMLVTPFTTIAKENKVSSNLPEQPDDVEGLVAQIRNFVNQILQKYGNNPMVRGLCNFILNTLGLGGNMMICIFLFLLLIPLYILFAFAYFMGLGGLLYNVFWTMIFIAYTMHDYCPPYNSFISIIPFQLLYALSETKDITKLEKVCPCLQA